MTPLSLDLTSRVSLPDLEALLGWKAAGGKMEVMVTKENAGASPAWGMEERVPGRQYGRHGMQGLRAAVLVLVLLVAGCGTLNSPGEVAVETISLQALYAQALGLARPWRHDAYLVGAETPFWFSGSGGSHQCQFSFRSPATDASRLVVEFDTATGLFSDRWEAIGESEREGESPIGETEWMVDSVDALEAAEAQGGAQFLLGRSSRNLDLTLRLGQEPRGGLLVTIWTVDYQDRKAEQTLKITVDARSGTVIGTIGP